MAAERSCIDASKITSDLWGSAADHALDAKQSAASNANKTKPFFFMAFSFLGLNLVWNVPQHLTSLPLFFFL